MMFCWLLVSDQEFALTLNQEWFFTQIEGQGIKDS